MIKICHKSLKFLMTREFVISGALIELEDYTLGKMIGQGSFGTVLSATNKKTGEIVAVKVMGQVGVLAQKKEQVNILREITVPLILDLPGIVKLKGFRFPLTKEEKTEDKFLEIKQSRENGLKCSLDLTGAIIVTELMENGSLETIVENYLKSEGKNIEKMNPTIRSKILFGIAATMKHVHQQNVIHRDLKLQNVFLDDKLEPRIADFGLAKVVMDKVDMTMAIGTPFYMAPEIFMDGDETYGISVDVYAFAFIIFKMFSIEVQFADLKKIRTSQQFMRKIAEGKRPKRPKSIPDCYWELVQKCWDQIPGNRPTFEEITEILKDDKFAIEEFGMKTDLDQLHEYQNRIDQDSLNDSSNFNKSIRMVAVKDKVMLLRASMRNISVLKRNGRSLKFNWKRH